jgi:hypothetical protein
LEGNSCLLSGGSPDSPVCHRTVPVAVRCAISFLFRRIRLLLFCGSWHNGHCPVHTGQSGAPCRPLARPRVARGLRGRPLASPDSPVNFSRTPLIVSREQRLRRRRLAGQSGAPPDSPVIYSRTPPSSPESGLFTETGPGAPDTVRCTTRQSGASRPSNIWLYTANSFPKHFLLFLALRHNTLVFKSMY